MDIKYVLGSIIKEAEKFGASGSLQAGVRLSGSVNGERGEGYWLLYEDVIVLLYRKLGQRDYEGCCGEYAEWAFEDYREEKYALMLTAVCKTVSYKYEFTPSERESAETILNCITAAHAEPQLVYSEGLLVMAGLFYLLGSDGHEKYAQDMLGKALYRAGRLYAINNTLQDLVSKGKELFNIDQKKSILLNLIEQRMSDDLWRSSEADALGELASVWELEGDFFAVSSELLLLKKKIGVLFEK